MSKYRLEVWFKDGLFRAFPNVERESARMNEENNMLGFKFAGGHEATINLNNVNFMEEMEEK